MNEYYYLVHGGPGSGRYPLGSGDRPYQKFEGSGRRRGGISAYIRARKAKKMEAKLVKQANEELQRRRAEELAELQLDKDKVKTLRGGSATEVMRYQGRLTNQELRDTADRLRLENEIRSYSQRELDANAVRLERFVSQAKLATSAFTTGKELYNVVAEAYNATPRGQSNPLRLIGKTTLEVNQNEDRRYRQSEERRKEERHRLEMEAIRRKMYGV